MNIKRLLILAGTVLSGLTLVSMWLLFLSGSPGLALAAGDIYTVCPAGPPTCDYSVIQDAVDAAENGDVIKVAAGTYDEVNNHGGLAQVVYIVKNVTIQGGYTTTNWTTSDPIANPTTLDAQGQGRVLFITDGATTTIEGLQITGGDATGLSLAWGGGVFIINAVATLNNNLVSGNTADMGGGVFLNLGEGTFTANTIIANTSNDAAGGLSIHRSVATLNANTISGNHSGWGGGLGTYQAEMVINSNVISSNSSEEGGGGVFFAEGDVTFNNNTVSGNVTGGEGGGLFLGASSVTFNNNTVSGNVAGGSGGGLFLGETAVTINAVTISGNTIVSNTATEFGGGLSLYNCSEASFINNLIADNQAEMGASGLFIREGSVSLAHNTITRNTRGDGNGLLIGSGAAVATVAMTNTIIVSQTVGLRVDSGSTATLEATLWGSGAWANGLDWFGGGTINTNTNHWGNPDFVDYEAGDYHIGPESDAIDNGTNSGCPATDLDGFPRPYGPNCDMGAYEFYPLSIVKHANNSSPTPGEVIIFTIRVTNNLSETTSGGLISDTLPAGLNFLDTITLDPPLSGTIGSEPPILVSDLEIGAGGQVTVTLPISVSYGLAVGTVTTNTAWVTSAEVVTPIFGSASITIANAPPLAVNDNGTGFITDEDTPFTTASVLPNDDDPNGDLLTVQSFDTSGTKGQVTDNGDGTFEYNPDGQFEDLDPGDQATDTFTYTISDGNSATDSATVTITINGVHDDFFIYLPLVIR